MKSIRIQNLRSLEDTGPIEIKPLTVLVGENSSGKSTFLRTFPLFRQSFDVNTTGPILWYGNDVDFGSFEESVNAYAQEKEIMFEFDLGLVDLKSRNFYYFEKVLLDESVNVKINVRIIGKEGKDSFSDFCKLQIADNEIIVFFSKEGRIINLFTNGTEYPEFHDIFAARHRGGLLPTVFRINTQKNSRRLQNNIHEPNIVKMKIFDLIQRTCKQNIDNRVLENIFAELEVGASEGILKHTKKTLKKNLTNIETSSRNWGINNQDFCQFRDLLFIYALPEIFQVCRNELKYFSSGIRYMAPVRATAERYYRIQNLAVGEVDFQGQNLAMILNSLSDTEKVKFRKWTKSIFDLEPSSVSTSGHVSIKINQGKFKFNLTDMGFGYSQMLPIITQLWKISNRNISRRIIPYFEPESMFFAIEQPELHLHPRLQSKLAIAFVKTIQDAKKNNNDIRLILETHSEAIINTLGRLVATKKLNNDDVNIVIFEKLEPDKPSTIRLSKFDNDGYLEDWPYGFFEPEWG